MCADNETYLESQVNVLTRIFDSWQTPGAVAWCNRSYCQWWPVILLWPALNVRCAIKRVLNDFWQSGLKSWIVAFVGSDDQ